MESADSLPENPIFLPPKRKKVCNTPDDISVEALHCMKSLTDAVARRDSHSIFADFISDSLRTANRPQHEVNLAKQNITQIIFNLQNGLYADNYSHSLPTTPSLSTASYSDGPIISAVPSPSGSDSTLDHGTHSLSSYVKNYMPM